MSHSVASYLGLHCLSAVNYLIIANSNQERMKILGKADLHPTGFDYETGI